MKFLLSDQPRGGLTILAPETGMFSHQHSTATELYFNPIDRSPNGFKAEIVKALGGARAADLRSILMVAGRRDDDLRQSVISIAGARGAELRSASADDVERAVEYSGWTQGRQPSDHQLAAMLHYYRRCMADRGEPIGMLLRAFDIDVFQSSSFGELAANVKV